MTIPGEVIVRTKWRQRHEGPAVVSDRVWATLSMLESQGGVFAEPFFALHQPPFQVSHERASVESLVELGRDLDGPDGGINVVTGLYLSVLQRPLEDRDVPRIKISFRAGSTAGGMNGSIANAVVMKVSPAKALRAGISTGFGHEVLAHGRELVEQLVKIWDADAASLDSLELLRAQKRRGVTMPTVGFVSWLSDDVVAGDLSTVEVFEKHRVAGGTLISVDVSTDYVLEDGLALVDQAVDSGLLKPLPLNYGA